MTEALALISAALALISVWLVWRYTRRGLGTQSTPRGQAFALMCVNWTCNRTQPLRLCGKRALTSEALAEQLCHICGRGQGPNQGLGHGVGLRQGQGHGDGQCSCPQPWPLPPKGMPMVKTMAVGLDRNGPEPYFLSRLCGA